MLPTVLEKKSQLLELFWLQIKHFFSFRSIIVNICFLFSLYPERWEWPPYVFYHVHMSYKPQPQSSFASVSQVNNYVLTGYGAVLLLLHLCFYPSSTYKLDYVTWWMSERKESSHMSMVLMQILTDMVNKKHFYRTVVEQWELKRCVDYSRTQDMYLGSWTEKSFLLSKKLPYCPSHEKQEN